MKIPHHKNLDLDGPVLRVHEPAQHMQRNRRRADIEIADRTRVTLPSSNAAPLS